MFITEDIHEQEIVNQLMKHRQCGQLQLEVLDDEIIVSCPQCKETVLNFYRRHQD